MTAATYTHWDEKDKADRAAQRRAVRSKAIQELPADAPEWSAVLADEYAENESLMLAAAERMERVRQAITAPLKGTGRLAALPAVTSIGQRTAVDLRHGDPPAQLVGEFLTPEDATVVYGPGGTGKGITACWLILRLVRMGHVVMVIDYEGHEREWGSRLRGLGATDDELARIHYRAPFAPDWTAPTGSLADVADEIRADAARLEVAYLVVDSYSVATSNGDTMGGQEAAREYFTALARIGLPSLTLAHVRGGAERWPDRPFGSVFVHNLARETWAVEQIGKPTDDEAEPRIGPHVVELEFRNRKPSGRPLAPPQFLTFEFFLDGSIEVREGRLAAPTVADLAADVLAEPMTLKQIALAIKEDTGTAYSEDTLLKALNRGKSLRFEVNKDKRPAKWSRLP